MSSLDRLADADAPSRLSQRDATLFSADPEVQRLVDARLGWTALASEAHDLLPRLAALATETAEEGVTDVVLLGMGGSSLAALVMGSVLPHARRLHVLDTISPITIAEKLAPLDPARTLWLVSSKSGGTIEPNSLYAIFRAHADAALGHDAAGKRFIAVTDPGSSLEALAAEQGFRAVIPAPPTVGGRFSALTAFGLVPAAACGIAIEPLLAPALAMEAACAAPAETNPAAQLAAFIADNHNAGRDKLTIVASQPLASFGLWVEQLVAESLGKHGDGVVPVVELGEARGFGADRAVVVVRLADDTQMAQTASRLQTDTPVLEIVMRSLNDLAAEFVRWEHAVALTGHLMGINPFDEPNVAEAKAATDAVLSGAAAVPAPDFEDAGVRVSAAGLNAGESAADAVRSAVTSLDPGDYLVVLAYLPDDDALLSPVRAVIPALAEKTGAATCFELGPRYLHSTGQLHKGGRNTGVFLLVTTRDERDVAVPGREWSLRDLHWAQAEGDFATLAKHGRRALHLDLPDASAESVELLVRMLRG